MDNGLLQVGGSADVEFLCTDSPCKTKSSSQAVFKVGACRLYAGRSGDKHLSAPRVGKPRESARTAAQHAVMTAINDRRIVASRLHYVYV